MVKVEQLTQVGLGQAESAAWLASLPGPGASFGPVGQSLKLGEALWRRLPAKAKRSAAEERVAALIKGALTELRQNFFAHHAAEVYRIGAGCRLAELCQRVAAAYPGLLPDEVALAAEAQLPLKEKEGIELAQALFLAAVLALPEEGGQLVRTMLEPTEEALGLLPRFAGEGRVDLGKAQVERVGKVGYLTICNERFLNAEDVATVRALEIGVDLILLDPQIEVGVLRGGPVGHPKFGGRRVFHSGINLTHLYHGRIPYLFYAWREMGFVNKLYRGLNLGEGAAVERFAEKPWLGVVDAFAIGGGCQLLPVLDYVIAEAGAYFTLPARKEGIIPGAANLRLARLLGERLARQAILFEREFAADSPEGRLIADEVVAPAGLERAVERVVTLLLAAGPVGVIRNRRALRVGQEPLEQFQAYMAQYARDQADCHFSDALVRNLEVTWQAASRQP